MDENEIKLIIWDLDDTLIYAENDPSIGDNPLKFTPIGDFDPKIGPNKVIDGPNRVQIIMPGIRQLLTELQKKGITMTFGSMGPEWQMRRFMEAFQIDHFFDWELGSYDYRHKGEKVQLCIDHYNGRLLTQYPPNDPTLLDLRINPSNALFVDDNLGYLGTVDNCVAGVKVLWAHYRSEGGALNFYRDLLESFEIDLR